MALPANRLKDAILLSLGKLSEPLRQDVIAGGAITTEFGIGTIQPIKLPADVAFDREKLFKAFQRCADGLEPGSLQTAAGATFDGKVSVDAGGLGVVEYGDNRIQFEGAGLFSGAPSRRTEVLDHLLLRRSINSSRRASLSELVKKSEFGVPEFIEVIFAMEASPESWGQALAKKLRGGPLMLGDLVPKDDAYWDNLVPQPITSRTLPEFITNELAAEWRSRLKVDPPTALSAIALTFAAPQLVPNNLLDGQAPEKISVLLSDLAQLPDPYSLAGAYELCRQHIVDIPALEPVGERLLDAFAINPEAVEAKCDVLAAVFIVSTVHLSQHQFFGRRPVFWRRLAAMAHSALVMRSIGVPKAGEEGLGLWASKQVGDAYLLSVYWDAADEPRWHPEWISDGFLLGDLMGRVARVPKPHNSNFPPGWISRIERIKNWIQDPAREMLSALPAALEGGTAPMPITLEGDHFITVAYRAFIEEPSADRLLEVVLYGYAFGYPKGDGASIGQIVRSFLNEAPAASQDQIQVCMNFAAYVAALNRDVELANVVAEVAIELVRRLSSPQSVRECVFRLLEVGAAVVERVAREQITVQRLETLAFAARSKEMSGTLLVLLHTLQRIDPSLAPRLHRAIAAANLGAHQD